MTFGTHPESLFRRFFLRRHFLRLFIAGALLWPLSQAAFSYENDAVTVLSARLNHNFSNDTFASVTLNSRWVDLFSETERFIGEIRGGKNVGNHQFSAAYNQHFQRRFLNGREHRLWQQYRYQYPLASSSLDFRARVEERYFTASDKAGARTRLVMYWNRPLANGDMFRLGNELVVNFNDYGNLARRGFSQDRLLAGYRHAFANGNRVDINYQYRYIHRPALENFIQHQLQMLLTFNM